jgi:RNA polymerase sigma-70 factor (ECF subfamily)
MFTSKDKKIRAVRQQKREHPDSSLAFAALAPASAAVVPAASVMSSPLVSLPLVSSSLMSSSLVSSLAGGLLSGALQARPALFMARASDAPPLDSAPPANRSTPELDSEATVENSDGGDNLGDFGDESTDDSTTENTPDGETNGAPPNPNDAKAAAKAAFLPILQRAKEGDRKAFEEIYNLYHRRIYNAAYGMLGDPDDAQDVTQDTFIRLHDALPTLRADEAFSTYIYRIALNLCRDRARRKKRVRFQSMDTPRTGEEGDVEQMEFPDAGKLPEETLTGDELQRRVREAVLTLSDDHKDVIVMHHFQGMEVNDIAGILNVPSGTVKSRLARGRDQLHRKLRTYLGV